MRRVICPRCLACFGEADKTWEKAISEQACPYCSRPLDVWDAAVQFDPYRADPDSPLAKWFLVASGLVGALAVTWLLLEMISWPILTLCLAIMGILYVLRRQPATYRALALVALMGAFGIALGWFTWLVPALCLLPLAGLKFLGWLGRPLHHRGLKFEDFPEFLGPWSESLDRRATILIEPDAHHTPRLRFRLAGRGAGKRLKVRFPRRWTTETSLLREIEALVGMFEGPVLCERPRYFELSLPAQASFTGSVASRAAEAAFKSFGCTKESTFTIFSEGGVDPYYELRLFERAAAATSGIFNRLFEARARHIRATLPKRRRPHPKLSNP